MLFLLLKEGRHTQRGSERERGRGRGRGILYPSLSKRSFVALLEDDTRNGRGTKFHHALARIFLG